MSITRTACFLFLLISLAGKAQFTSKPEEIIRGLSKILPFHPLRMALHAGQYYLDIFDSVSVNKFRIKSLNISSKQLSSMQKGHGFDYQITFDKKGRITSMTMKNNELFSTYWECVYDDDVLGMETRYMLYKDQEPYLTCESTYGQTGILVHKKYTWTWRENTRYIYAFPVSEEMFSYDEEHRVAKYIFQHENKQQTIQFLFAEKSKIPLQRKEVTKTFKAEEDLDTESTSDLLETLEVLFTYKYDADFSHLELITSEIILPNKITSYLSYRYDERDNLIEWESKGESADIYTKELRAYNANGIVTKTELWGAHNKLTGTYRMEYKSYKNGDAEQWTTFIAEKGNTSSRLKYNAQGLLLEYSSDNTDADPVTKANIKSTYETRWEYTFWN